MSPATATLPAQLLHPDVETGGDVDLPMHLDLLGGFELRMGDRTQTLPVSAQRLLALLAVQERPVARTWAASTLWPDKDEARAAGNLRSTLWRLRQLRVELVVVTADRLMVAPEVDVDVHRARELAWRILDGGVIDHDGRVPAELLADDLLTDWYDDWVMVEQERIRQLRLHALEELCEGLAALGRSAAAVDAGLLATRCDPLRESAQRALIIAYIHEGNHAEAHRQYQRYAVVLDAELGIEPSRQLTALVHTSADAPVAD